MADIFTRAKRSFVMSRILGRGNERTESRFLGILREHSITGWRRHQKLPGCPDFVFRKQKVAVFVDGCFWHCCPKHGRLPDSNLAYWLPKLARNKRRDRRVSRQLRARGWAVLRFWEHDLKNDERVRRRLLRALTRFSHLAPLESPVRKHRALAGRKAK